MWKAYTLYPFIELDVHLTNNIYGNPPLRNPTLEHNRIASSDDNDCDWIMGIWRRLYS